MEHIFSEVAVSIDSYCLQINSGIKVISFLDNVPFGVGKVEGMQKGVGE